MLECLKEVNEMPNSNGNKKHSKATGKLFTIWNVLEFNKVNGAYSAYQVDPKLLYMWKSFSIDEYGSRSHFRESERI